MSYMADKDHIAITSRDASTTRCKFLYRDTRVLGRSLSLSVSLVILIVAWRRVPEIASGEYPADRYSARHRLFGEHAPRAACAPVHRRWELALADGRSDPGGRLVTAQRVAAEQPESSSISE
jgi:hypothetical protein